MTVLKGKAARTTQQGTRLGDWRQDLLFTEPFPSKTADTADAETGRDLDQTETQEFVPNERTGQDHGQRSKRNRQKQHA